MYIYIHIMKAVLRLVLTATDSKGVTKEQVSQISPSYVKLVVDVFWMSLKEWCIRMGS